MVGHSVRGGRELMGEILTAIAGMFALWAAFEEMNR